MDIQYQHRESKISLSILQQLLHEHDGCIYRKTHNLHLCSKFFLGVFAGRNDNIFPTYVSCFKDSLDNNLTIISASIFTSVMSKCELRNRYKLGMLCNANGTQINTFRTTTTVYNNSPSWKLCCTTIYYR